MAIAEAGSIPVIDVRTIPRMERHPRIFAMVDGLAPGATFVLASDHDPRPLHYQLEMAFPTELTWEYLEQGPELWRVEIGRNDGQGCDCCCGSH
ncbi:DUF2249 domain-containing protein [Aminobacter niigataensis]|uniref:DUF2249 domain-containing protein n=1 Tax=Aminobacter niigataensis TaxID=83265 RepID=UPI0024C8F6BE|nr:DUF2249 domain-containing protein [Aminobacter niigataensis]CAI2933853.1 conserved protein of unknown function [Aminobacter niigataensis]